MSEHPGLQPTYEGLKQITGGFVHNDDGSLQPTYEGLKLQAALLRVVLDRGLQPTYEGLKQDAEELYRKDRVVCSLPMRD